MKKPVTRMGFVEFILIIAAMSATQAFAIDGMLPAFPVIAHALHVTDENEVQWILTAYLIGLGCGQLFWGALSDRFGRRTMLLTGLGIYAVAATFCGFAHSFRALLYWRFTHGLAAASVTVSRSMIRDLYSGRQMARVMSLTFMVFLIVPILAPSLGQLVLLIAPWPYIFFALSAFSAVIWLWALLRLQETLHVEYRLTLDLRHIAGAVRLVLGNRVSLNYTLALTFMAGALMAYIGTVPQIFADVFQRGGLMPTMFAACAFLMGIAAYSNSRLVERLGMRLISHTALLAYIALSVLHVFVAAWGDEQLWTFVLFQGLAMAAFSLASSNFGAMAMEPIAAVAGIGASLQGFISTLGGGLVGAFIGHRFNGTTLPLAIGTLLCGGLGLLFVLLAEHGRLFRQHHAPTT